MSYQVLARKWRPRNFQEVVGQQHVLTALSNGLAQNRVHHAYLFSGTRGVGKTTIARILAKSLNCEQGVTATPCGKCVNCQAIDQGRFVDLLEIDAASRTKVDDTREMLDNVQYKPAQGRYKVYLIDEVHMLSKHSFNALLKTLEEPPEYVKFLLATTDPQKLPITVLSRCLQFHLKAILPDEIEKQLAHILEHEQATFEKPALAVIAKAADGSMRDALSLTDQALAFGSGNIEYQSVLKMLGTIDNSHLLYLLHFIASGNVEKVFQKIAEFVHLGADFAKLHQDLASLCHKIALLQIYNKATVSEKTAIQLLADRLTPEEVQLYYQITLQGYKDYAFAPNGKIALEMTVMRLLAFRPVNYLALDESLLQSHSQAQLVEVALPSLAAEKRVSNVIEDIAKPVSTAPLSITPTAIQEPVANIVPIQEEATPVSYAEPVSEMAEVTAPLQEKVIIEDVIDNIPAPVTAAQEPTHSRNMLRSHRLKREQAKKHLATPVNDDIKPVVAKNVEHVATTQPVLDTVQSPIADQKSSIENVVVKSDNDNANGNENKVPTAVRPLPISANVNSPNEAKYVEQLNDVASLDIAPLPPIDSYSDFEASGYDGATSHSEYAPLENVSNVPENFNNEAIAAATNVAPTLLKNAGESFFTDDNVDRDAVDIAKYVEDKLTDPWSLVIQKMDLLGLVKVLAKNCTMQQVDQQIILTLKKQQHLLNDSNICEQLQDKLKAYYGDQISMYIEVGEVEGQLTPFEGEHHLYQQYLDNAKQIIKQDKNIKKWVDEYGAKVYENSIIPL